MASGHASSQAVVVTKIVFTAIAGLLTVARLYTRTQIVRNAGLDDVFIGAGLVCLLADCSKLYDMLIIRTDCFCNSVGYDLYARSVIMLSNRYAKEFHRLEKRDLTICTSALWNGNAQKHLGSSQ